MRTGHYGSLFWITMVIGCGGADGGTPGEICGDGVAQKGEECDEGAANSDTEANACRTTCAAPACGDGVADDGEGCDEGAANSDEEPDACRNDCFRLVMWTQTYDTGTFDSASDVAVDASGNVIVVGTQGQGDASDIWVRKLDPNGEPLWTRTYGGAAGMQDVGRGVAVDAAGNVIAAGYETTAGGETDAWVRKYDPEGNEIWTRTHAGAAGGDDKAADVAVDGEGSILVVGEEMTATTGADLWLRKYDSDGGTSWTVVLDGVGEYDAGRGVATDTANNVLVGGGSNGWPAPLSWILKYDAAGEPIWAKDRTIGMTSIDYVNAIAVDSAANVIVPGHLLTLAGAMDARIERLDAGGETQWVRSHDAGGVEIFVDAAVDAADDVLIAGFSEVDGNRDGLILKYAQSGDLLWARTYDTGGIENANAVAAAPDGTVVAVGVTMTGVPPTVTSMDVWIRKYGP